MKHSTVEKIIRRVLEPVTTYMDSGETQNPYYVYRIPGRDFQESLIFYCILETNIKLREY
jgi:hypothetical protein